mmetsp:Transcript_9802/g.13762  ORF Transcript_9802/g.13762 Transcript_9802/m.13762 type:complete len:382 (-) Transcript_9802:47-1192(-)
MRVITGDETGLLKVFEVESGKLEGVYGLKQQTRKNSIIYLRWDNDGTRGGEDAFFIGRTNGVVQKWAITKHIAPNSELKMSEISLLDHFHKDTVHYSTVSGRNGSKILGMTRSGNCSLEQKKIKLKGPVDALKVGDRNLIFGGKNNILKAFDFETERVTWKAKNVKKDPVTLLESPIFESIVESMAPMDKDPNLNQLICFTGHRDVRIYDRRAGTRPQKSFKFGKYVVKSAKLDPLGTQIVHGDVAGNIGSIDLRMHKKLRKYEGGCGSIRCLDFHPTFGYFAAIGLDRMCRIYSFDSDKMKAHFYLKQRANSVLFYGEKTSIKGKVEEGGGFDEMSGGSEEYEIDDEMSQNNEDFSTEEDIDLDSECSLDLESSNKRYKT